MDRRELLGRTALAFIAALLPATAAFAKDGADDGPGHDAGDDHSDDGPDHDADDDHGGEGDDDGPDHDADDDHGGEGNDNGPDHDDDQGAHDDDDGPITMMMKSRMRLTIGTAVADVAARTN